MCMLNLLLYAFKVEVIYILVCSLITTYHNFLALEQFSSFILPKKLGNFLNT